MTLHAGENAYICHWAKDPLTKEQLTGVDVALTITIWDFSDDSVLVNEEPMVYDAALISEPDAEGSIQVGGWYYIWQSGAAAPGSYQARISVVDRQAWEYKTIRLRADKAPVVV